MILYRKDDYYNFVCGIKTVMDISIPLTFNGPQPNAYGVEPAVSKPCAAGDLMGDTRRGGSVNFEQYTFIPHCNGTHTECVGHITHERISVLDCLRDVFVRAVLVSVEPEDFDGERLITANSLRLAFGSKPPALVAECGSPRVSEGETLNVEHIAHANAQASAKGLSATARGTDMALIVRTLPNDDGKLTRQYGNPIPPYFTTEAMEYIVERGFKHLLVDMPSIDRIFDGGKLSNHRIFWRVEPGSFETNAATRINSTITELIYVPNEIEDGEYLLNLQIAPFVTDASPSRPILFAHEKHESH